MPNVVEDVASPAVLRDAAVERATRRRAPLAAAALAGAALLVGLVVLLYFASVHAVPGNSDGATVILEGQAMGAGNLTLHHWFLSFDSFWGVDAPIYALAVLVAGLRPELLNLVPAAIAACVVVVGMWLARHGRRGAAGAAGALVVLALLAFPTHALSTFYLQGPLHVGTALWCLLAFASLCTGYSRWRWAVAVLFLATGAVGDLQTLAFGVLPLGLGGVLAALRTRRWREGVPAATAAAASVVLALVAREVAKVIGTFTVNKSNPTATLREMLTNLKLAVTYGDKLLGVGSQGFGSGGVPSGLLAVHVLGVLAILAGVLAAAVGLVRSVLRGPAGAGPAARSGDTSAAGAAVGAGGTAAEAGSGPSAPWRLDDVLLLAFLGDLAVFVILTPAANPAYARYLTAAIVFGAILAGRLAARVVPLIRRRLVVRASAVAAAAATLCFAASVGYNVAEAAPLQPTAALGRFLAAHGLVEGVGDYWSASIVTVESRGRVRVRPVTAPFGRVVTYTRNSSSTWYTGHTFQFLVYNPALPFGDVDAKTATATFGKPAHVWAVDGYLVLAWRHRISVASGLP